MRHPYQREPVPKGTKGYKCIKCGYYQWDDGEFERKIFQCIECDVHIVRVTAI